MWLHSDPGIVFLFVWLVFFFLISSNRRAFRSRDNLKSWICSRVAFFLVEYPMYRRRTEREECCVHIRVPQSAPYFMQM